MGAYDHGTGKGHVPYARGQYWDAIENRKSRVHLLVHEASFGGMCLSPYAAKRLRRLGHLPRRCARGTDKKINYGVTRAATPPLHLSRTSLSASRRRA